MKPGSLRVWLNSRWFRTDHIANAPAVSAKAPALETELPDSILSAVQNGTLPMLLLAWDQEAAQRSAFHFVASEPPGGMGCITESLDDPYHRSWNDFKWACRISRGHLNHTLIQLCQCYNVNYMPFLRAGNMSTKKELILDWEHDAPCPDEEWKQQVDIVAQDCREARPTSESDTTHFYDTWVLGNSSFRYKGKYAKMHSWYSIVEVIDKNDPMFHSLKYMMRAVARLMLCSGEAARKARTKAARELLKLEQSAGARNSPETNEGKEQHKKQLAEIKKRTGNLLLLCPALLHNLNKFNSRVILLVTRPLWSEQSVLAEGKMTPEQQMVYAAQLACGKGTDVLRLMWKQAVGSAEELARIGLHYLD